MREIKFRAWDKEKKQFFVSDGNLDSEVCVAESGIVYLLDDEPYAQQTDRFVLMQYTGLKDKNGKEIYEGDVLEDGEGFRAKVIFDDINGMFVAEEMNTIIWYNRPALLETEVIGNIYEHPELLEREVGK